MPNDRPWVLLTQQSLNLFVSSSASLLGRKKGLTDLYRSLDHVDFINHEQALGDPSLLRNRTISALGPFNVDPSCIYCS